jgi:sigma-B regulation protein RsbU (phosphoserine phosphatase)
MRQGQPLGVFVSPTLNEQSLVLPSGATLLLYTDGMTEAINEDDEFFGLARLRKTLRDHCHQPAQAVCDGLLQAAMDYQGTLPQFDDMTLVAIQALDYDV